jgi:hypothetical protein
VGRNRGLGLFGGNWRRSEKERIMNDGESFVALFFGFWDGFFFFVAKHFFLLYKNENDGDDDDEGGCCVKMQNEDGER